LAPALTVLVSTAQPWPELEPVLDSIVADVGDRDDVEVVVCDGTVSAGAVPDGRYPAYVVRLVRDGPADVFALRARGIAAATGDVVAIVEDHAPVLPGWTAATLAGHAAHPDGAMGVGSMRNGTATTVLDRAAYAITLGPFDDPVQPVARERLPVPANISYKRSWLPTAAPAIGWLEYEAPSLAFEAGLLFTIPDARCLHVQHFDGIGGITIQFVSGRSYGGSLLGLGRREKARHLASRPRFASIVYRTSGRALGPAPGVAERLGLLLMIGANVLGQAVGLATGPGRARAALR
jgi:hypothetical protein